MDPVVEGTIVARRYRLIRRLGSGETGAVWLAHDLSVNDQCAIKLLEQHSVPNEEAQRQFIKEAKTATKLRGTHVVDVFDYGEWSGIPFVAMELLEGEDLAARLRHVGRLDARTTYELIAQVARALVRAHGLGIVHRALKPENIFLASGGDGELVKVLDFGIAQPPRFRAKSDNNGTSKSGWIVGAPGYMSPEQARDRPIDWRSDLWSLAVIAFECLIGHPPFQSDSFGDLLAQIMYEPIPQLTEQGVDLPETLAVWWQRAVARDRQHRFQSAKELADTFALAAGLEANEFIPSITPRAPSDEASDTTGIAIWISEPPLSAKPLDSEAVSSATRAALSRKKKRMIATGAAILAVLCGLLLWSNRESASESAAATDEMREKPARLPPDWALLRSAQTPQPLPPAESPQRIVLPSHEQTNILRNDSNVPSKAERPRKKRKTRDGAVKPQTEITPPSDVTPPAKQQRTPDSSPDYGI